MATKPVPDPQLVRLTRAFTADWLAAQRWYRRKSQAVVSVSLVDAARLSNDRGWLLVLDAANADGARGRYLVPAIEADGGVREPHDGEGVWRGMVELMAARAASPAMHGRWVFDRTPALLRLLPGGAVAAASLGERTLRSEQSNTSVSCDDLLILKVYRLQEPGEHPEVEINAFLTDVGFPHVPALAGTMTYQPDGGPACAAAILQEFVVSEGNAWGWALGCLRGAEPGPAVALDGIAQVGRLTAELHAALASRPELDGFPARMATNEDLAAWRTAADDQLEGALAVLAGEEHARLRGVAERIRSDLTRIQDAGGTMVSRIHGDFHLGQLLRTATGFNVIDFEGEPARPMAERRAPSSPLRDVAGMLRSIDYAAQVARRDGASIDPDAWVRDARDAYLAGYGSMSGRDAALLHAFEVEKACYEVRYEANNRPDWVWLPLAALERLAA